MKKGSWKTTVAGICYIVVAGAAALGAMLDNDPATVPDWSIVAAAIVAGFGLISARDNKVSSEQVDAK